MNKPNVGASPFAATKIPLNSSSSKIMQRAVSSVDSQAAPLPALAGKGSAPSPDRSTKAKFKGIYFDPDVLIAMAKTKSEKGVSFSFQVNQAMRNYLDI